MFQYVQCSSTDTCVVSITCTHELGNSVGDEMPTYTGVQFVQDSSTGARVQVTWDRCPVSLACNRRLYVRFVCFVLSRGGLFSQWLSVNMYRTL